MPHLVVSQQVFSGGRLQFTSYLHTIGVEFSSHYLCLNEEWIKVQIWDASGDSRHRISEELVSSLHME